LFIAFFLIAILGTAGIFALQKADRAEIEYDEEALAREAAILSDVVDVGGIACTPRKNIRSYLIMGIDDTAAQGDGYVMGGQCDVLNLLVVDHTNMTYQYLPINRNTICDVRWYDVDGNDMGTSEIQIAYAHAVGDGGTFSCENTVEAVSNYLGGVEIQSYIALDMSSIATINRLVGGVTVTIDDDFSATDPSLVKGETITLTDEQAETFVRARTSMKDDSTNEARMRRQQVFLDALRMQMLEKAKADAEYALFVYDSLEPEMVTNMNGKAFSRLVNGLTKCENLGPIEINGTIGMDDLGYATFVPDKDSVRDAAIALYYRPAQE
jgi:anionic cell wall polymer biosynthesis LytR-Cps2A-Psr (LCP) family protein